MRKIVFFTLFCFAFFCEYSVDNKIVSSINEETTDDADTNSDLGNENVSINYSNFIKGYYNTSRIITGSKEFILVDGVTNTILLCKNEKQKMYPSSMTKMMTLYVLFDYLDSGKLKLGDVFNVSNYAHNKQGSKMFLASGEKVSINDLINGIVVVSGNDAAITVAENIAGSETAFKDLMQEYASELGMKDSHFNNCTGWPDQDHFSSAYDIMLLAINLWKKFPTFNDRFSQKKFSHNGIKQSTYNDLMLRNKNVDGIKTGHTDAGGYGIAATYRCTSDPKRRLFLVINGAKNEKERREDALRLFTFAERNFGNYVLFKKHQKIKDMIVVNGTEKSVGAELHEDIVMSLDRKFLNKIKCYITYNRPLQNVKKGDKIGVLKIQLDNESNTYDLYADKTIEKANIFVRFVNGIKYILLGEI